MSDRDDDDALRRRAVRAAKAVTLGAALVGSPACSGDTTDDSGGWNVGPDGGTGDVVADTAPDTSEDTRETGPTCSSMEDGTCPNACGASNDADCCEQTGGTWTGGACAVPGPFVPPAMPSERA